MKRLKKKDKLVSIVIPTFNCEKTIINSINSILLQKLDNQVEIIVVDDNSSDKTIFLINNIKLKKNFKLKIFQNKINKGSGFCRKLGIKMASGYYIAFLDADDYWLENKLTKQVKFLESKPNINFTYSDYYREINYINKSLF